ncbi:MAG: DUF3035 domain-containing protein [Alphaproteobacteria bacterium]
MRARTPWIAVVLFLAAAAGLAGCSDARKALGYDKSAPDEFKVLARAPLAVPPDFGLRPPQPGESRPQETQPTESAKTVLLGKAGSSSTLPVGNRSRGEMALLKSAGAERNIPDIGRMVDREATALVAADRGFTDRLVFWQKDPYTVGNIVDPEKEARRLRENQALGKQVTEGETPIIKRRKKALLEGLF